MRALTEFFKTIVWFPWAILELSRGDLGPDARGILLIGVGGTILLLALIVGLSLWTITSGTGPLPFPYLFVTISCAFFYMLMGASIRIIGRHLWVLR